MRPGDVGRLQAIQLAAGDAFRNVGMSSVAESPPLPAESLSGYRQAGRRDSPERVCMRRDVLPGSRPAGDTGS